MITGEGEVGYMFNGQPEYSEQAQRALDLKADLPLRFVDSGLSLSVQVDDFTRPEFAWLRRLRTWRNGGTVGPVAAQFSYATLNLTAGVAAGTQLCVVDSVMISNQAAVALQYVIYLATPAVLGALINPQPADDRLTGRPVFECRGNSAAAAPVSLYSQVTFNIQAGDVQIIPGPWVLTGNAMLVVQNTTLNSALQVGFFWRERLMMSSEK